tara:strand:- start:65 stop:214 length:150 start_codon:yes stop_codon:yes gene_type:complete
MVCFFFVSFFPLAFLASRRPTENKPSASAEALNLLFSERFALPAELPDF